MVKPAKFEVNLPQLRDRGPSWKPEFTGSREAGKFIKGGAV
jgi:hypothetical protein